MPKSDRQMHWEEVYATRAETEVSWYQERPSPSFELLELIGARQESSIIDIGGGASALVDHLISIGYTDVTVLDISESALAKAKDRIGPKSRLVTWIVADVTTWQPSRTFDIWHDRATFHFLTEPGDQRAYVERLTRALRPDGHLIIGTFSPDGPRRCSGLPVVRYNADGLSKVFGQDFVLVDTREHEHVTPAGATQRFEFSTFKRVV